MILYVYNYNIYGSAVAVMNSNITINTKTNKFINGETVSYTLMATVSLFVLFALKQILKVFIGVAVAPSCIIAFITASIISFLLERKFVFGKKMLASNAKQIIFFIIRAAVNFGFYKLSEFGFKNMLDMPITFVWFIAVVTSFLFNYIYDRTLVFDCGYAGKYKKISVIDERKELSSGFDIGINTDVISSYKKAKGIELAVRTLSPELIVCDEIGNSDEVEAIKFGFSSGTSFILSIHLKSINDLMRNQIAIQLISTREFSHIVFLHGIDEGFDIIDLTEDENENGRNSNDIRNIYTPFSEYM